MYDILVAECVFVVSLTAFILPRIAAVVHSWRWTSKIRRKRELITMTITAVLAIGMWYELFSDHPVIGIIGYPAKDVINIISCVLAGLISYHGIRWFSSLIAKRVTSNRRVTWMMDNIEPTTD